jgi:phospholipase C
MTAPTVSAGDQAIRHVVLLMMENHSFDQMLGSLQDVNPDLDGVKLDDVARFNLDLQGNRVLQAPTNEQQVPHDPNHDAVWVQQQIAGHNTGFVTAYQGAVPKTTAQDYQYVMGYYLLGKLPALHELGQHFTVCDRWFSSLPGPTWPNRFFALSGTSSGCVKMPEGLKDLGLPIFDRLSDAKRSWRVFYYDFPSSLLLAHQRRPENLRNYAPIGQFFEAVRKEATTFPEFVFIEPKYFGADENDDHPPGNVFKAEKLMADVYNAIRSNPALWVSTLLVIVYDEHGGFYDHVFPPPAVPPDTNHQEYTVDQLGVRVPALLVSPWVSARVEHTEFDHTSLLKYLTDKWHLGPLGARVAAAQSIAVVLDQPEPRADTIPFIRIPYTFLIPDDPSLDQGDGTNHHEALHALAAFVANEKELVLAAAIMELARAAGLWVRIKAAVGRLLQTVGRWFEGDLKRVKKARIEATTQVPRKLIDGTSTASGASGAPGPP